MRRTTVRGIAVFAITALVVAGAAAATVVACDQEVRDSLKSLFSKARGESKTVADTLTEDMMLKKARLRNDPSINQSWTESQWETIS